MNYFYKKIDNIKIGGFYYFYRVPIDANMCQATEFNEHFRYYYKCTGIDSQKIQVLGTFIRNSKRNSGRREDDYDYDVYEFSDNFIPCSEKCNIYCVGIPESNDDMIPVINTFYGDFPVYCKRE
jgi:hypothetical protein